MDGTRHRGAVSGGTSEALIAFVTTRTWTDLRRLSAMPGVESHLQAHIRNGMKIGLTAAQLRSVSDALAEPAQIDAACRTHTWTTRPVAAPKMKTG